MVENTMNTDPEKEAKVAKLKAANYSDEQIKAYFDTIENPKPKKQSPTAETGAFNQEKVNKLKAAGYSPEQISNYLSTKPDPTTLVEQTASNDPVILDGGNFPISKQPAKQDLDLSLHEVIGKASAGFAYQVIKSGINLIEFKNKATDVFIEKAVKPIVESSGGKGGEIDKFFDRQLLYNKIGKEAFEEINNKVASKIAAQNEGVVSDVTEIENPNDAVNWGANTMVQLLGQVGLAFGTGGVSTFAQAIGDGYDDALTRVAEKAGKSKYDVTTDESFKPVMYAATSGIVQGLLEKYGLDRLVKDKLVTGALTKKVTDVLMRGGIEGVTEVLQGGVSSAGTALAANDDLLDALKEYGKKKAINDFAGGTFGGSVFRGSRYGFDAIKNSAKKDIKAAKDKLNDNGNEVVHEAKVVEDPNAANKANEADVKNEPITVDITPVTEQNLLSEGTDQKLLDKGTDQKLLESGTDQKLLNEGTTNETTTTEAAVTEATVNEPVIEGKPKKGKGKNKVEPVAATTTTNETNTTTEPTATAEQTSPQVNSESTTSEALPDSTTETNVVPTGNNANISQENPTIKLQPIEVIKSIDSNNDLSAEEKKIEKVKAIANIVTTNGIIEQDTQWDEDASNESIMNNDYETVTFSDPNNIPEFLLANGSVSTTNEDGFIEYDLPKADADFVHKTNADALANKYISETESGGGLTKDAIDKRLTGAPELIKPTPTVVKAEEKTNPKQAETDTSKLKDFVGGKGNKFSRPQVVKIAKAFSGFLNGEAAPKGLEAVFKKVETELINESTAGLPTNSIIHKFPEFRDAFKKTDAGASSAAAENAVTNVLSTSKPTTIAESEAKPVGSTDIPTTTADLSDGGKTLANNPDMTKEEFEAIHPDLSYEKEKQKLSEVATTTDPSLAKAKASKQPDIGKQSKGKMKGMDNGIVQMGAFSFDFMKPFRYVLGIPDSYSFGETIAKMVRRRGSLPYDLFNKWIGSNGEAKVHVKESERLAKDITQLLEREKAKGKSITPLIKHINDVLNGGEADLDLPAPIARMAEKMRAHIDAITGVLQTYGAIGDDLNATFDANKGVYVHTWYKIHIDPKYQPTQDVINRAMEWALKNYRKIGLKHDDSKLSDLHKMALSADSLAFFNHEYKLAYGTIPPKGTLTKLKKEAATILKESISDGQLRTWVEGYMNKHKENITNLNELASEGTGSVLKRKKLNSIELADLLGKIDDPIVSYMNTVKKMAETMTLHDFTQKMVNDGKGTVFFKAGEEAPEGFSFAIPHTKGTALEDYRTSKPISDSIRDLNKSYEIGDFLGGFMRVVQASKAINTVYNLFSHGKNLTGAVLSGVANGYFAPTSTNIRAWNKFGKLYFTPLLKTAYQGAKESISTRIDQNIAIKQAYRDMSNKLLRLGIYDESATEVDVAQAIKVLVGEEKSIIDKMDSLDQAKAVVNRGMFLMRKFYMQGDNIVKTVGFFVEAEREAKYRYNKPYNKLSETEQSEVDQAAALVIRATTPTASEAGAAVNYVRMMPFIASFPTYHSEILRTSYNIVALAAKELKSGRAEAGLARLTGMMSAVTLYQSAKLLNSYATGDDEEKIDRIRSFALRDYEKENDILLTSRIDENGDVSVIDMTYNNGFSVYSKALRAFMKGDELDDKVLGSMQELTSPFTEPDMVAKAAGELVFNRKFNNGTNVYNQFDLPEYRAADIANQMRPIIGKTTSTFMKSYNEKGNIAYDNGDMKTAGDFLLALVGQKSKTINLYKRYGSSTMELNVQTEDILKTLNNVYPIYRSDDPNLEQVERIITNAAAHMEKISMEYAKQYNDAVSVGLDGDRLLYELNGKKTEPLIIAAAVGESIDWIEAMRARVEMKKERASVSE